MRIHPSGSDANMSVRFDVREVSKPILAASAVVERGCGLHRDGAKIRGNGCA